MTDERIKVIWDILVKCFEALDKDVRFEALDNVKTRWIFKVRSGTAKAGKRKTGLAKVQR